MFKKISQQVKHYLQCIRRNPGRTAKYLFFLAVFSFLVLVVAVYFEIRDRIVLTQPTATPFFEDFQGNYISEGWGSDTVKGYWQVSEKLPPRIEAAFLSIEDKRFYQHGGVDWHAIGRAVINNITGGSRHGASTIAMQVARMQNPGGRTYWKKCCELVTARLLVRKYGREAIFRQYLKLVPMGNRIHGASYASRRYFRKPLQDLGWSEAALLAALPKAPGRMNLFNSKGFERAVKRGEIVLECLLDQGHIDRESYRVALQHLRSLTPPMRETRPFHSFHAIMNMERAMKAKGITSFSRPVRSGLDLQLQEYLTFLSEGALKHYRRLGAGNMSIMVVERDTGVVRGYLGSEYYYDEDNAGSIDYGLAPRSSGSTLKPFIYALGIIENKYRATAIVPDLPYYVAHSSGQYLVFNYDNTFLGPMLYRKALANSRNIPAVHVLRNVGLETVHGFFRRIGLERSDREARHYGLGLAVGGLYVTLQDLVRSYGILANDGRDFQLKWFEDLASGGPPGAKGSFEKTALGSRKTFDSPSDSNQLPEGLNNVFWGSKGRFFKKAPWPPEASEQILPENVCRQIALFLSDPLARLPSFQRMGALEYPFPVAVKTGTSQGFRDAWAVAWSRRYIVGVWIGHPNNDRMKRVNGLSAASVVKQVMLHLHPEETRGVGEEPFPPPRGYRAVRLCAHSGQLATDLCSDVILEYFKPGTEPVSECRVHRRFAVDRRSGLLAGTYTPPDQVELKTFSVFPSEYSVWAVSNGYEKPPVEVKDVMPRVSLEIRNPVNRAQVLLDPETPRKFQTLPLRAKVTPSVSEIVWIVDGEEREPVSYPYVYRWQLEPGEHTFQARFVNADVRSKVVTVTVSEY